MYEDLGIGVHEVEQKLIGHVAGESRFNSLINRALSQHTGEDTAMDFSHRNKCACSAREIAKHSIDADPIYEYSRVS
jgi:hypothetical protein